jgi:hypothetical protein
MEQFNDLSTADENKKNAVEHVSKNYKKEYIYSSIENLEVVFIFEHNAGLMKLS